MQGGPETRVPWAHLDDHFYSHPKVVATPLPAVGLFAIGLSYCGDQLTDGFIPRSVVVGIRGWTSAARMLIERNFWNEVPGGYQVHDYLDWNDSREQVLAKRKGAADRAASSRERRRAAHVTEHVPRDVTRTERARPVSTPLHSGVTEVTPRDPPNPLTDATAFGAAPRRGSPEPTTLRHDVAECPICRLPFSGTYLEHTAERHKVNASTDPGNLFSRARTRDAEAPPPDIEAQFQAMHERLQALPEQAQA